MSRFGAIVVQGVACGIAVGCATGLLEVLALLRTTAGTAVNLLVPAMAFYSLVWSVVAVGLGVALYGFSRALRQPFVSGEPLIRWDLALCIPLAIFIIGGGHINMHWLPAFTDWRSLLFDGMFLIANCWLGLWLYHRGIGWASRLVRKLPARRWLMLAAAGLAVGVLSSGGLPIWGGTRGTPPAHQVAGRSGPNVLLIAIDALRPDHLSVYGYPRRTSPNLEHLAQEGVIFTNAFANSSWTRASVATIFTSLYPSSHGVNEMGSGLSGALLTLPEALHEHGYATGIFSANPFVSPRFGYAQGVESFHHRPASTFSELMLGRILRSLRKRSSVADRAYGALKAVESSPRLGRSTSTDAPGLNEAFLNWVRSLNGPPFFAYLHYMEVHTPYHHPEPFRRLFDPASAGTPPTHLPLHEGFAPFARGQQLPPEGLARLVAQYDGAIAYFDRELGELFGQLQELGLYDRTVIIVTADHGEEFYEHEGWGHGKSLFNEVIRVPLIVRYPPAFPSGAVIAHTAQHVDLMPTILDLCNVPMSGAVEGYSLASLIQDAKTSVEARPVYSEALHGTSSARAVQDGRFKLIHVRVHDKEAWLLFDLSADPAEQRPLDVTTHARGPQLKHLLESFQERAIRLAVAPQHVHVTDDTREQLRALGYLQ
jgi:arylsulfatase A-like enzyme